MTPKELSKIGVFDWKDIKIRKNPPDLLLGNGFSVNINRHLSYKSLFNYFLTKHAKPLDKELNRFGTPNFELILNKLNCAYEVNRAMKLEKEKISQAIECLKTGLIKTIRDVIQFSENSYNPKFKKIAYDFSYFNDIYTTNYDLFLYYIILTSNKFHKPNNSINYYSDYYYRNYPGKQFLKFKGKQLDRSYKYVHYLHGSLFIFNRGKNNLKIRTHSESSDLISLITERIKSKEFPLFVSEGSNTDKKKIINNNDYLSFCLSNLKDTKKDLLVYGHSLSDVDSHILDAIRKKPRNLIISIYPSSNSTLDTILQMKESYVNKFPNYSKTIEFIDSRTLF